MRQLDELLPLGVSMQHAHRVRESASLTSLTATLEEVLAGSRGPELRLMVLRLPKVAASVRLKLCDEEERTSC